MGVQNGAAEVKISVDVLPNVSMGLPCDPAAPPPSVTPERPEGRDSRRELHPRAHGSTSHNTPGLEAAQVSVDGG